MFAANSAKTLMEHDKVDVDRYKHLIQTDILRPKVENCLCAAMNDLRMRHPRGIQNGDEFKLTMLTTWKDEVHIYCHIGTLEKTRDSRLQVSFQREILTR